MVKLQRYIIQRVARGDDQSVGFPGDLLEMFRAYVLTEEAAQDAASSEYSAVLDDSVEESPTPFLNIQGQETLSDREVADHPFTKQFMRQAAMCLHPRYRYHLRVHGTDHYLTEDPEYAQTVLGEWKIVALHRKDAIGRDDDDDKEEEEEDCSNSNDNSNSVCLRLDFAGEDEYAGDREAAAKIERITGSEYNWSSFNEEAYTFSRMLFRAAPHADRPYPASRLCFADAATADALRVESCTVTIVHPHEATSKTLPITAQTTVRELFETVSRKFRGCSSPAVDTPDKFAMKVCGLELYLFPTDTLPLLRAPRVARAARRGKRITLVIVPADGLVAESPVPIDFVLPHAPAGPATIPSTRDQRPFEIIVASGALPLDAPRCLRVEAAIYYGGRRISSFFATRAEPPAATAAAGGAGAGAGAGTIPYVWNSHMVFDLLVPNLPRESRVCIAVLSVPKSADSDGFTQTTDAEQSPRSLLDANAGTCQSSFSSTITTAAVTASQSISATAVNSGSGSVIVSPPPVASNGLGNGNNGSGIGADRSGSPMATSGNGDDNGSDRVKRKRSLSSGIATGSEVANESGNDGNSSSDSDDEEAGKVRPVYWTSFPVYNYRSVLISGQHSLQLLKGKVNPIGICVHAMNLHENAVLRIDVPSSSTVVYSDEDDEEKDKKSGDAQEKGKQGSPEEVSLEDKAKLDKLIMSDSLYTLTDEDKALIWKHRHYLKSKPQSIIKLLLAAPTTDYHIFNEIHT